MSDKVLEQISALVDDELGDSESELLIRRMEKDSDLRERWEQYHFIGSVMRRSLDGASAGELAGRVYEELGKEPPRRATSAVGRSWAKRLARPVAGAAVAASVAVVAVLGIRQDPGTTGPGPAETVPSSDSSSVVNSGLSVQPASTGGTQWNHEQPAVRQRLQKYLVNHSSHASAIGRAGVMPYVYIAVSGPNEGGDEADETGDRENPGPRRPDNDSH